MIKQDKTFEIKICSKGVDKSYHLSQKTAIKGFIDRSLSTDLITLAKINHQLLDLGLNDEKVADLLEYQEKKTVRLFGEKNLIDDEFCFPRSEYCARYIGTTAFLMKSPQYWASYHRSEGNRFFKKAGSRKGAKFLGDYIKGDKHIAVSSHVGGYKSPFTIKEYQDRLIQNHLIKEGHINVRDEVLIYQKMMARVVFDWVSSRTAGGFAFISNEYPCLMIDSIAFVQSLGMHNDLDLSYWKLRPKMLSRLLMCVFVALMNIRSEIAGIPIEIVLRSSFGHYLPSVSETGASFRINIGLVPKEYLNLMVAVLIQMKEVLREFIQSKTIYEVRNEDAICQYNLAKMVGSIDQKGHHQLHSLKELLVYKKFHRKENLSPEEIDEFNKAFREKNKRETVKGWSNHRFVDLSGKTLWQLLSSSADSKGMSVLFNCFRVNGYEDWLINLLMKQFEGNVTEPLEKAIHTMVSSLRYEGDLVSLNIRSVYQSFEKTGKRCFSSLSFQKYFDQDIDFHRIMKIAFSAFDAGLPVFAIYGQLERVRNYFFRQAKSSKLIKSEPDYGSDSEFELASFEAKHLLSNSNTIYHKKLRVCSGMKAIVLSHLGILGQQVIEKGARVRYKADTSQMYYEVDQALTFIDVDAECHRMPDVELLYFDLNHVNAEHINNLSLVSKIDAMSHHLKRVVVLDITSACLTEILSAIDLCFSRMITLVLLVNSGLKNDQGAADNNPYGELRVLSTHQVEMNSLIDLIKKKASEFDKLPQPVHELVRVCKKKGLTISLHGMFKSKASRFMPACASLDDEFEIQSKFK